MPKLICFCLVLFLLLSSPLFLNLNINAANLTPLKVCHPVSGNASDLCAFGWARPSFSFLSAQNQGADQPQITLFTVNDLTVAGSGVVQGTIPSATTNAVGQKVSANSNNAIALTSGHQYRWTVQAFNQLLGSPSPADLTPWVFTYDSTLPSFVLNPPLASCYTVPNQPLTVNILATDPVPVGVGNVASGIAQVWMKLDALPETLVPLTTPPNTYRYTFPVLTPGTHQAFIRVVDNAGNFSGPLPTGYPTSPSIRFSYSATICTLPWLQTTRGDVHTNTGINAPGGPL